jgi:hypothetical protein
MKQLGGLKILSLKEIWDHEALDFTPWLAKEENLSLLSDAVGLDLQFEKREVPVGPYSADILARDASGIYVVIETQFKKTDHDHLGKLLTYGATLGASVLIWVAETFTDEHRKAIQWLNDRTTDDLSIYAVQPELLQIDNSNPAIRFNVISRPNEVVRAAAIAKGDLSEAQKTQLEFWTLFRDRLLEKKIVTSAQTPRPQYWFNIALGRSNMNLSCTLNTETHTLGVRVYMRGEIADAALQQLAVHREKIEQEIGAKLQWNPFPEKQDKIITLLRDIDLEDRTKWTEYCDWLVDMTDRFLRAFKPRVKTLDLVEMTVPSGLGEAAVPAE